MEREEGTSKRMVGEWVHEIQVDLDRFFSSDTKTLLIHVYIYSTLSLIH